MAARVILLVGVAWALLITFGVTSSEARLVRKRSLLSEEFGF